MVHEELKFGLSLVDNFKCRLLKTVDGSFVFKMVYDLITVSPPRDLQQIKPVFLCVRYCYQSCTDTTGTCQNAQVHQHPWYVSSFEMRLDVEGHILKLI